MLVPKSDPALLRPKKIHLWAKSGQQATVLLTVGEISKRSSAKVSLATWIWKSKAWSQRAGVLERAVACVLQMLTALLAQ